MNQLVVFKGESVGISSTAAQRRGARVFITGGRMGGKRTLMATAFGPIMSAEEYEAELTRRAREVRAERCTCCDGSGKQTLRFALHDHERGPVIVTCPNCDGRGSHVP